MVGRSRGKRRKNQIELREAIADDVPAIIPDLLEADHAESVAVSGLPIRESLAQAYATSDECWTVLAKSGKVIGIGGARRDPDMSPSAAIWFVCTRGAARAPKTLVRVLREKIHTLGLRYGFLYGFVDARNTVRQRWIEMLGFRVHVEEMIRFGHLGLPFYQFISVGHPYVEE